MKLNDDVCLDADIVRDFRLVAETVHYEIIAWTLSGTPPSEIADMFCLPVWIVMEQLHQAVFDGDVRRSEIVFSIDKKTRKAVDNLAGRYKRWKDSDRVVRDLAERLEQIPETCVDDGLIYFQLWNARLAVTGDSYEYLYKIEVSLHDFVKHKLVKQLGRRQWWREGVPENIRVECVAAREQDPKPATDPYSYTNFIHLKEIFDKQWPLFSRILPKKVAANKKLFLSDLLKLNETRNRVMHPCKGLPPTEEDFLFMKDFVIRLQLDKREHQRLALAKRILQRQIVKLQAKD